MRAHLFLTGPVAAATLALAACAPPPEADLPMSERVLAAPTPLLAPTADFAAPIAAGEAAIAELGPERDALAARAAALRDRGAAMSAAGVLDAPERERLTTAGAAAIEPDP